MKHSLLLMTLLMAGCVTLPEQKPATGFSQVEEVDPVDARAIVQIVTTVIEDVVPPGDGTLKVLVDPADTVVTPKLLAEMKSLGYRLAPDDAISADHLLQYQIGPHGDNVMVRLQLDQEELPMVFRHAERTGTLRIAMPPIVREVVRE